MALVDIDTWETEFTAIERLHGKIAELFWQRSNSQRESAEYMRYNDMLQKSLQQFHKEMAHLRATHNTAANGEPDVKGFEVDRRLKKLQAVHEQLTMLQRRFANIGAGNPFEESEQAAPRNPFEAAEQTNGRNPFEESEQAAAIIRPTSVQDFRAYQTVALEQQDRGLESLSQTISRQRELAAQLGNEVENQNEILDNLANTMERVDGRVYAETRNIRVVNERDSTWAYWITIVLLFIAIIVLLFI